jgi:hypothetical protein
MFELGAPAVGGGQEWRIAAQRPHMDTEPEPMGWAEMAAKTAITPTCVAWPPSIALSASRHRTRATHCRGAR